jgi:sortase A
MGGCGQTGMRWIFKFERPLLIVGLLSVAFYLVAAIHRTVLASAELQSFKTQQEKSAGFHGLTPSSATPDFSLWSDQRVKAYQMSLVKNFSPAIAILRIPKIHVEVPVMEGTDDLILNRGVGHVVGTTNPGENGNVAIAGHRDGFFRGLKDVSLGDTIGIATTERTETYVIDRITIVDRTDVSVLGPRPQASMTLITCYPFYFIGSAPKRYIVQASIVDSAPANRPEGVRGPEAKRFQQLANAR